MRGRVGEAAGLPRARRDGHRPRLAGGHGEARSCPRTFDAAAGLVRARRIERYGALTIREHHETPDPIEAGRLVADAYLRRPPSDADEQLIRRLAVAGVPADYAALVRAASAGLVRLADVDVARALTPDVRRHLARLAPAVLRLPNGTEVRLDYRSDGRPVAAVKLQKLIGVTETPRLGPRRIWSHPELLAPNNRPVQVTSRSALSSWARSIRRFEVPSGTATPNTGGRRRAARRRVASQ